MGQAPGTAGWLGRPGWHGGDVVSHAAPHVQVRASWLLGANETPLPCDCTATEKSGAWCTGDKTQVIRQGVKFRPQGRGCNEESLGHD